MKKDRKIELLGVLSEKELREKILVPLLRLNRDSCIRSVIR